MSEGIGVDNEVESLRQALDEEKAQTRRLEAEVKQLRHQIDVLSRRLFGVKSEKLDPNQRDYLEEFFKSQPQPPPAPPEENNEEDGSGGKDGKRRKRGPRKPRFPDDLEVVEEYLLPEAVKANPDQWREIGREVLEQIDFTPGKFLKRLTIRPKFAHISQRDLPPIIHPARPQLIDRGIAAPGLLVFLIISKFCDHLPFYRQEKIFSQRHGVYIPRQQMVQWSQALIQWLGPIYETIKKEVKLAPYLQIDETRFRYQDKKGPEGSQVGYLWEFQAPNRTVVYHWPASRSSQVLEDFLGLDFEGLIHCDGYKAYNVYANKNDGVTLIGCWAHCRRKFEEAKTQDPIFAGWVLRQFRHMYRIEDELRAARAGPNLRAARRAAQTAPIIRRLRRAIEAKQRKYLPKSGLGKALSYALDYWTQLERVVDHGVVELDNNLAENAIRPLAIGRKNWLFFGDKDAGQDSAIFYTLIQNCRIHQIDPARYLLDLFQRLPYETNQTVENLTPAAWAKTHPEARVPQD